MRHVLRSILSYKPGCPKEIIKEEIIKREEKKNEDVLVRSYDNTQILKLMF